MPNREVSKYSTKTSKGKTVTKQKRSGATVTKTKKVYKNASLGQDKKVKTKVTSKGNTTVTEKKSHPKGYVGSVKSHKVTKNMGGYQSPRYGRKAVRTGKRQMRRN